MRHFLLPVFLLLTAASAQAQQTPDNVPTPAPLSEDSVRAMSGLVQRGVRQLHDIYYESSDARAVQRIEAALQEIPTLNQRLKRYTTSLPRDQQLQLAQRLRQQPWQVELQTLLRSPQFQGFTARAAKNPALKSANERLQAAGFIGSAKPAAPTTVASATAVRPTSPAPAGTVAAAVATRPAPAPTASLPSTNGPVAKAASPPITVAATTVKKHTVQKGETLFSIAKQYSVKAAQLQAWNAKPDDGVKIGEVLVVEGPR